MYKGNNIAVVVPAYNEEGFVGQVIDTVPEYVDTTFVIDDHSKDGTWDEIVEHANIDTVCSEKSVDSEDDVISTDGAGLQTISADAMVNKKSVPRFDVVPVRNQENRGRGYAVKTGYRLALLTDHDVIAVMDGDGQMDPAVLKDILDPIVDGEADHVKGNRLVSLDNCEEMSNWRLFGNILLSGLTKVASGHWQLRDPQNGYTASSAEALACLPLDELYDRYGFLNDLLIRLSEHDFEIVDVPMEAVYSDESSSIRYRTFVPNLSILLLEGFLRRLWKQYMANGASKADQVEPVN